MNPGLLREPLALLRQGPGRDALGQPMAGWVVVAGSDAIRGRRMRQKTPQLQDSVVADRYRERKRAVFRVRSQPFLGFTGKGTSCRKLRAG